MKAMGYDDYGSPDVLSLREIERPSPADDEVLVGVYASSVNSWDWDLLRGTPFMNRIGAIRKPKYEVLGADISGKVEAVGPNVKRFEPGDEVFADLSHCGWGGFAEYVCAPEDVLAEKPAGMTFEEAAAVPQAAVLALQGLRKHGDIQPGETVLINGAGGGSGTFAVQMAKWFGAHVTGVDSAGKLDLVSSLGADEVVDYTREDFTRSGQRYDLILDTAAHHSMFAYRNSLAATGSYVMIGGSTARIVQIMTLGPLLSLAGGRNMGPLMHRPNARDLDVVTTLIDSGAFVPVIDSRYVLDELPEALLHFGQGGVKGKVVVTIPRPD